MIDIHAHILSDLDDGPGTDQDSLRMALQAVNDGIGTIIATPHLKAGGMLDSGVIQAKVKRLNTLLKQHQIRLEVLPGAEVLCDGGEMPPICLLNNGPYMLVEFPQAYIPGSASDLLYSLRSQGVFPILAHPERNGAVMRHPTALLELLDPDVYVQITAASVTGSLGSSVQQCAFHLLRSGAVHFLATDCHSPRERMPELSLARKISAKLLGHAEAERLVEANPLAVVRGERFN